MKKVLIVLYFLIYFLPVKGQWIPVRDFANRSSYLLYINASGNNEYQYIRSVPSGNKFILKSGTIYSDGTVGSEYTYPVRASSFCSREIGSDTIMVIGQSYDMLGLGKPDTVQLAVLRRGQVILNFSPPIYGINFLQNIFKLGTNYLATINDSLVLLNTSNFSVTKKLRSAGRANNYNSYFYNNGSLCGQTFRMNVVNTSYVAHGNTNVVGNMTLNLSDQFSFNTNISVFKASSCLDIYLSLRSSTDSITFYNFNSGQLVQKINSKRYFYRKTIDPPIPLVANTSRIFSITSHPDSIFFVNEDAYPYRKYNGQHRIYHFNRNTSTYDLVDSAYIENSRLKDMHIKNRQVITVDGGDVIYIKQFPLSTPKVSIQPQVIMYPNPVKETLGLSGFEVGNTFLIQDALGRICKQGIAQDQVDVAELSAGFYRLTLKSIKGSYIIKFVKQ